MRVRIDRTLTRLFLDRPAAGGPLTHIISGGVHCIAKRLDIPAVEDARDQDNECYLNEEDQSSQSGYKIYVAYGATRCAIVLMQTVRRSGGSDIPLVDAESARSSGSIGRDAQAGS